MYYVRVRLIKKIWLLASSLKPFSFGCRSYFLRRHQRQAHDHVLKYTCRDAIIIRISNPCTSLHLTLSHLQTLLNVLLSYSLTHAHTSHCLTFSLSYTLLIFDTSPWQGSPPYHFFSFFSSTWSGLSPSY